MECLWLYRGVSIIDAGRELRFIDVARHDGLGFQPLKRGTGFTVACYTLMFGERNRHQRRRAMESEDYKITSDELWSLNTPECLPRSVLMFPQVNIDRPHVVHFLVPELRYVIKKIWVVAIDMDTKTVEGLKTEDANLTYAKSEFPVLPPH
ncbi:hypothetical protein E2562_022526 [Oryza meyeriana var. granulata]|uniref:DUF1618 domain-containing protein n=1 Tax=Oryza meyeriana var. granulata TaxID=110450 RepID=A0A6G1BMX2_9ORYZ|nr:hypothetical protein E2562_022524 [Oryza meyeriana var. granulata]KAF0889280.1 hypothetical protein E2562_022526 [Oryza meyeriana var. granulata]